MQEKRDKKTKDEIKQEKLQKVLQKEKEVEQSFFNSKIDDLESSCYMEMDNFVEMVKLGTSYGAIIEGSGGTGKTWRIMNHLQDCDKAYTDSFTTPQALYCWMYRNRNKDVLIIDDVAGFLDNDKILAFLKGGLWHVGDEQNRYINYMTSKPLKDEVGNYVPNKFILNARMVIITNKLNQKNPHVKAILTRINHCQLEIPYDELINILSQVAKKEYDGLTYDERMEVFNFIKNNASESTENLNIRTLVKCFQQKVYSNLIGDSERWKKLATISLLNSNPQLVRLQEILLNPEYASESEKIEAFMKSTGRTKSTYYRWKKDLKKTGVDYE